MATESRTLRVLQQNVQGNLQAKARLLTQRKRRDRPHIITLQETGISQLPNAKAFAPGYTLFATGPAQSPFQGVAVLLDNRLAEFVRGTEIDKHGRYVILSLRIPSNNKWRTLMIASAYLPSGLETKHTDDADYLQAKRIHDTLCDRAQHHDATIVAGDFNETLTSEDRSGPSNSDRQARLIGPTTRILQDTFRHCHPLTPGHTNTMTRDGRAITARLDYILTKGLETTAVNVDPVPGLTSSHDALTATLKFNIQTLKKTSFRRRQLRTSGITDEMCKKVAQEALAGLPATDLVHIADKIFKSGEHIAGLKGHRLPLKHARRQTTADKLKHEVDNIVDALQLLKDHTAGKKRWARIFKLRRGAPTLRDLRKPRSDLERHVALRHAHCRRSSAAMPQTPLGQLLCRRGCRLQPRRSSVDRA